MESIFTQITALLVLTVLVAWITRLLKQPIIVAYIFAGLAAGPLFLKIVGADSHEFDIFSGLGVILLLFVVGLSLNFDYLKKIGKIAVIGGLGQAIFTGVFGYFILQSLGFEMLPAIYLAIAITFSSTIIITKLLSDKKHANSLYGRHTIGLLLVQDIIAVLLMVILVASTGGGSLNEGLLRLALGGIIFVVALFLASKYLLPAVLKKIAGSTEFLFLFSLAWCFLIAYLSKTLGFSYEIGAVAAGLALASSPYQPEINARVTPLKDFFLIIFFIILGAELDLTTFSSVLIPGAVLALFILIGNPLILYILYRFMKFTRKNSLFIGLTAAQVSEFGFVLLYIGSSLGHIAKTEIAIFTLVALSTIFVSAYLITYNEAVFRFLNPMLSAFGRKNEFKQDEDEAPIYDVWVAGYHRIGWSIVKALKNKNTSFAVIDYDPYVIENLKKTGTPAYFIDVGDAGLLADLPLDKAKMIISTIPSIEGQIALIKYVRTHNTETIIVANSPEARYISSLYEAGADYVMTPHLLGGKWLSHLITEERLGKTDLARLRAEQEEEIKNGLPVQML